MCGFCSNFDLLPQRGPFELTSAYCGAYARAGIFLRKQCLSFFVRLLVIIYKHICPIVVQKNIKLHFIGRKNVRMFAYVQFL